MGKLSGTVLILAGVSIAAYTLSAQQDSGTRATTAENAVQGKPSSAPAAAGMPASAPGRADLSAPRPADAPAAGATAPAPNSETPPANAPAPAALAPPPVAPQKLRPGVPAAVRVAEAPLRLPVGETAATASPPLDRPALTRGDSAPAQAHRLLPGRCQRGLEPCRAAGRESRYRPRQRQPSDRTARSSPAGDGAESGAGDLRRVLSERPEPRCGRTLPARRPRRQRRQAADANGVGSGWSHQDRPCPDGPRQNRPTRRCRRPRRCGRTSAAARRAHGTCRPRGRPPAAAGQSPPTAIAGYVPEGRGLLSPAGTAHAAALGATLGLAVLDPVPPAVDAQPSECKGFSRTDPCGDPALLPPATIREGRIDHFRIRQFVACWRTSFSYMPGI